MFQILDEMNLQDEKDGSALVGVCNQVISVDKVKGGTKVSIGAPDHVIFDIMNGKTIPILLLVNKEEYFKREKESSNPQPHNV